MKLKSLIIAIGMFASTCAFADMDDKWNSPECVFVQEADEAGVREMAAEVMLGKIDVNRAMTLESYSFKDVLIATEMVVCLGYEPQAAVTFVDPD